MVCLYPVQHPPAGMLLGPQEFQKLLAAVTDEKVSQPGHGWTHAQPGNFSSGHVQRRLGNNRLFQMTAPGDLLHRVTVTILGIEIHSEINSGRVLPEDHLHPALLFENVPPIDLAEPSEACDPVTDGNLISRLECLFLEEEVLQGTTQFPSQPTLHDSQDRFLVVKMIQ